MSDFLRDYLNVVWFAATALVLAGLLLGLAALLRERAKRGNSRSRHTQAGALEIQMSSIGRNAEASSSEG